ncbi:MAG: hypothetical protein CK424_07075 [Legionella sp.]|nr:MAG: hypothetical protein CK424_07075 [Legionella sp.]
MIDALENNSGKISIVLGCCALAGGAILLGMIPGGAVLVTAYGTQLIIGTTATCVAAVAAGASYYRKEISNQRALEQVHCRQIWTDRWTNVLR